MVRTSKQHTLRRHSSLGPREQADAARRLRLEWASAGAPDPRAHAAGVGRMLDVAERADRRRHGPRVPVDRAELEAAYAGTAA